ncbi:MAG: hypothetical protein KC729_18180, partial [Candidatus Eisenbacteria bacterium]|nr:hypothetical protein [Candidatus Eisenbacteria bacterium]
MSEPRNGLVSVLGGIGLTRAILSAFLIVLWLLYFFGTDLAFSSLVTDCLIRTGMNGILVLALVPAV